MAASIAWLDASADEQRRVRELIRLFSQRETQDEIGGRRIVIALSDVLFPGTSVLLTRARYLVIIPHLVLLASRRANPQRALVDLERRMIASFLADTIVPDAHRLEGLIGRRTGPGVKQLPSSTYWGALEAWGILRRPGTIAETLQRSRYRPPRDEDPDELADRPAHVWHPAIHRFSDDLGDGFPVDAIGNGFRLEADEASWLRERWVDTSRASMLTHLSLADRPIESALPWDEPRCTTASSTNTDLIDQAHRFSLVLQGAQLLYQLVAAQRYQDAGLNRIQIDLERNHSAIDDWAAAVESARCLAAPTKSLFDRWEPSSLWEVLAERGLHSGRATLEARAFFDDWFDVVLARRQHDIAKNDVLRRLVIDRERQTKGASARLSNTGLLANWGGGIAGPTTYRWPQVKRLVNDVLDGLGIEGSEATDAGT